MTEPISRSDAPQPDYNSTWTNSSSPDAPTTAPSDEYCVRAGYGSLVGGACVEPESVQDAATELYEDITSTVETWLE